MKRFFFLLVALTVAMMSWEGQLNAASVVDSGPIPQESIRLRIIANSDSFQDQWLKREVRDAIVAQMNTWVKELHSYDQAKQLIEDKLPELQKLVDQTIKDRGFAYPAEVELGKVPFPTKLYGSYVYPAGDYEALRVRIGQAQGQNWWCVLFPPLCFIDMSNGDAVEKQNAPVEKTVLAQSAQPDRTTDEDEHQDIRELRRELFKFQSTDEARDSTFAESKETTGSESSSLNRGDAAETAQVSSADRLETAAAEPKVEVRFYLWDKLMALF